MPIRRALILSSVRALSSRPASTVRTPGHRLSTCATSRFRRPEFPQTKTSQSRGAPTSPRRRAGTVFRAATRAPGSGSSAASCSLPEAASSGVIRIRPASNDTGTVTSIHVVSGAAHGAHLDTRSAAAEKGDARKRTFDCAATSRFNDPRIRVPPSRRRFNSDAVAAARLRLRDPTRTSQPALARRRAMPRPSCPVPASTPSFTPRPLFFACRAELRPGIHAPRKPHYSKARQPPQVSRSADLVRPWPLPAPAPKACGGGSVRVISPMR